MKHTRYCLFVVAALVGCHGEPAPSDGGLSTVKPTKTNRSRDGHDADAPDAAREPDAAQSDIVGDTPIARENRLPGSDGLEMTKVADGQIDGYTSAVSVAPGETVELHVNVEVEQDVQWELFRIGDYQGHGARSVAVGEPARVAIQPVCPPDPLTGLIECNWATAFRVAIAAD